MHELIACMASVIILTLFIAQTAANTNTFIEAAYSERVISEYCEAECSEEELIEKTEELKADLERMPGVRAEVKGGKLDIYLDGIIGPAGSLGITDNSICVEKELKFKVRENENEQSDDDSGDLDVADDPEQDTDGNDYPADPGNVNY